MGSHETIHSIMLDVAIAMLSATAFGIYHFSMHALLVLVVTVTAYVLSEYVYEKLMRKQSAVSDCNTLVMGMILALNMPPEIPVWIPTLDGIFATIVIKQLYDGLRQDFMNPVLVVRCLPLISFVGKITNSSYSGFDGVSGATPLVMPESGQVVNAPAMFVGSILGTIGEVSVIALLISAAYLLAKKVVSIQTSGAYMLTVVIFAILFGGHGSNLNYIAVHLCGGGLTFGAFLMVTDYMTNPIMPKGQIVFDILLGVLTRLFRIFGGSAEGVSYATIVSNIPVPLIEKVALPKAFGKEGK